MAFSRWAVHYRCIHQRLHPGGHSAFSCLRWLAANRGGGLVYDDVLNVTWRQDANYAKSNARKAYPVRRQ
jgi:hypothetical protein